MGGSSPRTTYTGYFSQVNGRTIPPTSFETNTTRQGVVWGCLDSEWPCSPMVEDSTVIRERSMLLALATFSFNLAITSLPGGLVGGIYLPRLLWWKHELTQRNKKDIVAVSSVCSLFIIYHKQFYMSIPSSGDRSFRL